MKLERQDQIGKLDVDTERGNVISDAFIAEFLALLDAAEADPAVRALVVTASRPSIFCPGIDLASMFGRSGPEVRAFYTALTGLVRRTLMFPKPTVFALNGETLAGGCMVALAGDHRIMADGDHEIGMTGIDVGLAAPVGIVEMLRHFFGARIAERVLFGGERFTPRQAMALGLVDELVEPQRLLDCAFEAARRSACKPAAGYRRLKRYARQALAARMHNLDEAHLDDLLDQWFSEETQRLVGAAVQRTNKLSAAPG